MATSFVEPPDGDEGRYASFAASTPRAGDEASAQLLSPSSSSASSAPVASGPDAGLSAEFVAQRGALSRLQGAIAIVLQDLGDFRTAAAAQEQHAELLRALLAALSPGGKGSGWLR